MRDAWLASLSVAPILAGDAGRFDSELDEHHWLGHRMVGETMRYAAVDASGKWVALIVDVAVIPYLVVHVIPHRAP